jgi:hypothetical protein
LLRKGVPPGIFTRVLLRQVIARKLLAKKNDPFTGAELLGYIIQILDLNGNILTLAGEAKGLRINRIDW